MNVPAPLFNQIRLSDIRFSLTALLSLLQLVILISPVEAVAEPVVTAFSSRQGSFAIHANNLNRVTEAEIRIDYQSEDPNPPQVSGSFLDRRTATLTSTPNSAGSLVIRIQSTKPLSGYVPLAVVQLRGSITFLTALLRKENGTTETARVSITNPTREQLDEWAAQKASAEQAENLRKSEINEAATATVTSDSRASFRSDPPPPPSVDRPAPRPANPPPGRPDSGPSLEPSVAAATDKRADRPPGGDELPLPLTFSRRESLFELFRGSSGERTASVLAGLLKRSQADFKQEPPLLLADGTASLRLTIQPSGSALLAPQFYISGGHYKVLKIGENGAWILEIIPEQGARTTSITVLSEKDMIEYPLAVAPPLELFDATTADPDLAEFVRAANGLLR